MTTQPNVDERLEQIANALFEVMDELRNLESTVTGLSDEIDQLREELAAKP